MGLTRIGIIGAMDEEVGLFTAALADAAKTEYAQFVFHTGRLEGHDVVVVKCGVGKVNAASCVQILIDRFGASPIIFSGVAGALNPMLDVTHLVISTDAMAHDMEARALGFERGQVPFSDQKHFKSAPHLTALASQAAKEAGLPSMEGRILSGDQFIADAAHGKRLREELGGDCVDMESAAVAQVCEANHVPHVIIRAMSDRADRGAPADFAKTSQTASRNSFAIIRRMLEKMDKPSDAGRARSIKSKIRTIPNWPKAGVMYRDITTLLQDKEGLQEAADLLAARYAGWPIDAVVSVESRGFILGAILADRLKVGFVPVRKPKKLPGKTISEGYELEYGASRLEIHEDALVKGARVLVADDLIATGGTALATCELVRRLGATVVECAFLIDLPKLGGMKKLQAAGFPAFALVEFEGE